MNRRGNLRVVVHFFILALGSTHSGYADLIPLDKQVKQIAFGSCAHQDQTQPIWNRVGAHRPDFFIFLGDNIYGDSRDMSVLKGKYEKLGKNANFIKFRQAIPVIATWDDHDFGANDAGVEFPKKSEAKVLMLDFFKEPAGSDRRNRDGVYTSYLVGPIGKQVQVILLDTRWFRSALKRDNSGYIPDSNPTKTMLGETQWQWLGQELAKPAAVRIIATSIQFLSEEHPYEKWANFPHERQRLIQLLTQSKAENTILLSGDRHFGELACQGLANGKKLCEATSSGLTHGRVTPVRESNAHRVAVFDKGNHYGLMNFDWRAQEVIVRTELRDSLGREGVSFEQSFKLD